MGLEVSRARLLRDEEHGFFLGSETRTALNPVCGRAGPCP